MVKFEPSEILNISEITNVLYLHFRMIFRNAILEKKLKDVFKIAPLLKTIVENTEIPDLPKTSASYKIINKILPHIDWLKIAHDSLEDTNKSF